MEELIAQLSAFLGNRVMAIESKGPAEIDIAVAESEDIAALSSDLQAHIVEIVDENSLAKINFVLSDGQVKDSFSLNQ